MYSIKLDSRRYFLFAKNNLSKSACTLFQGKLLNNQTVWPVIFGLTGPICARALKSLHLFELHARGHQDWPVKPTVREFSPASRIEKASACGEGAGLRPGSERTRSSIG